jgi:hypothetical protein
MLRIMPCCKSRCYAADHALLKIHVSCEDLTLWQMVGHTQEEEQSVSETVEGMELPRLSIF